MDRRRFLIGAGAFGVVACAQPERRLLDDFEGVRFPLEPGPARPTPTLLDETQPEATVVTGPAVESPYPVSVPEADLPGIVFIAEATTASVVAHKNLGGTGASWEFANPIASGQPLVFVVEEFDNLDNFGVLLPTRPSGTFGWISSADVQLKRHNYAIRVELDAFRLVVFDHNEIVFETTIGVAGDNSPTPQGRYYTTELIRPAEPHSVYGAFAYGLSGYSDGFTEFTGSDGQLGIHGTNDPDTLGGNVSGGCIRLHNDDISYLVRDIGLPAGVPVEVT